jgi:pimeloyl-ACP methyl ester carboxylesterase
MGTRPQQQPEQQIDAAPAPRRRSRGPTPIAPIMDGPFAETKELVMGSWPASLGRYAPVNGLRMYYEVHGPRDGRPLVLLHGGLGNIDMSFRQVVSALAIDGRRVIAIEQQAHGRTADIDRRLTCAQMADDAAELLRRLDVRQADFFGFSMGGSAVLQIALQHPGLARKLAVVSSGYGAGAYRPDVLRRLDALVKHMSAEPFKRQFERHAARPGQWDQAWKRMGDVFESQRAASQDPLRNIRAETLFVTADEGLWPRAHTRELAELVPGSRVVSFAGDDHDPQMISRAAALMPAFLDAR